MPRLNEMLDRLRQRLPVRSVALLPGELFYCHCFEIPEGTPTDDLESFAELSLEGAAPYPIENLAWGFLREGSERLLVYAASIERLKQRGYENLEQAWQVLPGFAFACGERVSQPTIRFASGNGSISALYIPQGSGIPVKVVSRPLPPLAEDATDHTAQLLIDAREALEKQIQSEGYQLDRTLYRFVSSEAVGEERICYKVLRIAADGSTHVETRDWPVTAGALWDADVRGRTFAAAKRLERRRSHFAWWGLLAAAVFALLLLLTQVGLYGWGIYTDLLVKRAAERDPEVQLIQNKANFAEILENATQREMKPFAMLQAANAMRPDSIHFNRIGASDWNVLRVEGEGRRGEEVTGYIDMIRASELVEGIRNVRTETRGGRITFDFEIVFRTLSDLQPLPAKEDAAAPAPAPESPVQPDPVTPVEAEAAPEAEPELQQEEDEEQVTPQARPASWEDE